MASSYTHPIQQHIHKARPNESDRAGGKGQRDIWVTKKVDGAWKEPVLVISRFAAEPSLDNEGNICFTHHFFRDDEMLEADLYVAYRNTDRT